MEDTSPVLVIVAAAARWFIAIAAALVVFVLYHWVMGPVMGWFSLVIGCAIFTAVAMVVHRIALARAS